MGLLGSDANFIAMQSIAPEGRAKGTMNLDSDPKDHFVIPSWHTTQLHSKQGFVLFSFSDRPVHQALGIHREERLS